MSSDLKPVIGELRSQHDTLVKAILDMEDADVDEAKIGELRAKLRLIRKQREMLEEPERYIERIVLRALALWDEARDPDTPARRRKALKAEGDMLMNLSEKVRKLHSTIPELSTQSLKTIKDLTTTMKSLAKSRKEAVKNLDKIVDTAARALTVLAQLIPLLALVA